MSCLICKNENPEKYPCVIKTESVISQVDLTTTSNGEVIEWQSIEQTAHSIYTCTTCNKNLSKDAKDSFFVDESSF